MHIYIKDQFKNICITHYKNRPKTIHTSQVHIYVIGRITDDLTNVII